MKKLVFAALMLGLISLNAFAGTLQGYVSDAYTNEPIENARVHITTNDGSHIYYNAYTDLNGFYTIDIPNRIYNGRALKVTEYKVTLIEGIEVVDGTTNIDFELIPTNGNHNRNKFYELNNNSGK